MALYDQIIAIYSTLVPKDFEPEETIHLQNDGQGDYIKSWNHPTHP